MEGLGSVVNPSARRWLASLAVLALGLVATGILSFLIVGSEDTSRAAESDRAGLLTARQIELLTEPAAQIADALGSYVIAEEGDLDRETTDAFMSRLLGNNPVIRSATLAPDNVITHIVPLTGNEAALGLDLESIPDQWAPIEPLVATGRPGLIGPFDLVQGGTGLAYRLPIYLEDGRYWGLASTIIDGEEFFNQAIDNAGLPMSQVAMRVVTQSPNHDVHTYGNPNVLSDVHQTFTVEPPGDVWQLVVATDNQPHPIAIAVGVAGTAVSVILALLTYAVIGARQRQNEAVERLNDLAALTPGMLFQYRIDIDGTTTLPYVSPRLAKTFNIDPETVAANADHLWDLVHVDDRDAAANQMQEAIESGSQWQQRLRLRDARGTTRWYQARATPETLRSGDVVLHGYLADVSEDVEAEERMSIHASVYEATHNGVLILSESGHIIDANQAFIDMIGYSFASLRGNHLRFLGSDLTPDDVYREIRASLERSESWRGEFTMRDAQGAPTDYSMTALQVRAEDTSVAHIIVIVTPVSELRDDVVTDLPGRLTFGAQLDLLVEQAAHTQDSVLLVVIGLDRFSDINSSLGHRIGDLVLRGVAERTVNAAPDTATVARIGGDEFALALPLPNRSEEVAATISALEAIFSEPVNLTSDEVRISASIGFATYPRDATNGADLLSAATHAMRSAKSSGGGQSRPYDPSMRESAEQRARITAILTQALEKGTLEIKFQPIVDLRSNRIVKAEALARLADPTYGNVPPDQFIPVAESIGRISEVGNVAFGKAMAMARAARDLAPDFGVSVNLSPLELRRESNRHQERLALLRELSLDGSSITVEITEEAALESDESTAATLLKYKEAGMTVAIDDFGTGYSSLSYLQRLPIDYVKIDRSFVSHLEPDSDSLALVLVMIEMSRTLGLQTIAEGIETAQQADLLRSSGCDFGQGYYFGAPMTADELLDLLREQAAGD